MPLEKNRKKEGERGEKKGREGRGHAERKKRRGAEIVV
jgi:hypothetical protein